MLTSPVPVVVVDDHAMIVLGLRTLFHNRPEFEIVAWAQDADEALAACLQTRPRVVVLDVALDGSDVDGVELCRLIRAQHEETEVVLYTGVDEMDLAEKAFAAGASGVVSKGGQTADLLRAVLLAANGKRYTAPAFAAHADGRDFDDLSPRQLTVLRLLAQGLERKAIAEQMDIGEETVKTHLAEVRRKLGARTSAQAVAIGLINALFDYSADD
jgi:two-component system, NarL family, invasion response regulator UvrY